jgi:hypothetical protein
MYPTQPYGKKSSPPTGLYIAIGVVGVLVVFLVVFFIARSRNGMVPLTNAPGAFAYQTSPSKIYLCAVPNGWSVKSDPDAGADTMNMNDGEDVAITINADNTPPSPQPSNVRGIADPNDFADAAALPAEVAVKNFKAVQVQTLTCPLGHGAIIDFKGDEVEQGSSRPFHGYSANIVMQNTNHVSILCYCPDGQWDEASPIFMHVIKSLSPAK